MLTRLVIQDVVLIDRLSVPFQEGLNVFTGETGAGKSILLDALALALGARSDSSLIRTGQTQASVTAEFSAQPTPALKSLFDTQGLLFEDPLILRRTISKDGKSRAFLCDQPISISLLRQIGELLLEVHGQFDTHGLLNPVTHRGLLDAFANVGPQKEKTAKAYNEWKVAELARKAAEDKQKQAQAEEDFLRAAVAEMDDVAPLDNECDKLAEQRTQLQHREKIVEALTTADNALSGEKSASASLALAGKTLARISDKAPAAQNILMIVDRVANDVSEAADMLAQLMRDVEGGAGSLEKIEERLFRLRALARKHGVQPESLTDLHSDLRQRLALLSDNGSQLSVLTKAETFAFSAYKKEAQDLSASRRKASKELAKAIMKELSPLKLERAVFDVQCDVLPETQWGVDGIDRVAFVAATNAGASLSPLQKVASGGELSRFMLAIKVVLAKADPVQTLVFDEVDAGIGGATASAVGERLALLGRDVQVLVVTHSPQVAARGNHHLRVKKQEKGKFPTTIVDPLSHDDRIEEIARMLAGAKVTPAAREAAASLLDAPQDKRKKVKSA